MSATVKPIKRDPALVAFSKDHHFGLLLVWKIRQGVRTGIAPVRISRYVTYFFDQDLFYHFADEEEYLFSELSPRGEARQRAENEHQLIRTLVAVIRRSPDDVALLNQFADLLEGHIRFEERVLFNQLQAVLSEEKLLKLLHEIPERPHLPDSDWEDDFWTHKK